MRFAALGANMLQARDGKRPRWVRADTVVIRKGVRVGILGLCYPQTPTVTLAKNVAHLRFADDSATAAARVLSARVLLSPPASRGILPTALEDEDIRWDMIELT